MRNVVLENSKLNDLSKNFHERICKFNYHIHLLFFYQAHQSDIKRAKHSKFTKNSAQKNLKIYPFALIDFSPLRQFNTPIIDKYETRARVLSLKIRFLPKKKKESHEKNLQIWSFIPFFFFLLLLIFIQSQNLSPSDEQIAEKACKKPRDRCFRRNFFFFFFFDLEHHEQHSGRSCFFRNCAHVRGGAGVSAEYTRIYTGSFRFVTQPNFACTSRHYRMAGGSGEWEVCTPQLICVAESVL